MEQKLGVREQAHVVADGGGEELPHGDQAEWVMVQDAEFAKDEHSECCREVLEGCQGAGVGKLHDGPFVDD